MASFGAFQSWMQYAQNDKCKWAFPGMWCDSVRGKFVFHFHLCTVSPVVFPGLRLCRAWLRWGSYIEGNEWDPVIHLVCGEWVWLWYCPQKDVSALPWFHILGSHRSLLCSCQAHESLKWWQVQQGCSFCSQHTFLQSWWSSWKLVALNILTRIGKGTHSLFPFNFSELFLFPYCLAATRW